jgi:anti-sigma B factor antagonist
MQEQFRIAVVASGVTVLVAPIGEIDIATVDEIDYRLGAISAAYERVVLDLRQVTFIDSTGLHLVLRMDAASRAGAWEFGLIQGPAEVRRIFELTQLGQLLRFVEPDGLPEPV